MEGAGNFMGGPGGPPRGVNVGGGSSTGRAIFAVCGGLAGAYYGFYLQSKYMEERRVRALVEVEARKRLEAEDLILK
ncbi:hypothetical protein BBI17_007553 [Phytophthora kernoviae]|uniref:Uncharacterized protein n=1 Tax=Phytophthora kernoviae TaxID=325452 RepID=A0A3F2RIH3_9STRA|nr:hypothetical protein JM18_007155 [Phytophthora kernoviae]RLN26556.1 hypothetical protein BBI17_007553 [Phytophthora kernoviae]RLN57342.1 hypothetical protein BBP00_00007550 [Phytophthora kernoviae]RLN71796.1 hypothetical protein BBJ29_005611 [Phytophthora kernoviae]